jgi:uncharacterized spore protein YtfJ
MPGADANGAALDKIFKSLSEQLICEPIELVDKVIIPIIKMDMVFGTNIDRTDANRKGDGLERQAAGGGAGLLPFAVLTICKGISGPESMKVISLSPPGESLSEIAYELMEKMYGHKKTQEKRIDDMAVIKVE